MASRTDRLRPLRWTARRPWLTVFGVACALAAAIAPGAAEALHFDRTALAGSELWRLLTGHFTHWTTGHLVWDTAAFAALGAWLERRSRALFAAVVAAAAGAIWAAVWFGAPELETYRGLSGIDTALFGAAAAHLLGLARRRRSWEAAVVPLAALAGLAGKTVAELASGASVFVDANGAFAPVPLAHLAGLAAGLATTALHPMRPASDRSAPGSFASSPAAPPLRVRARHGIMFAPAGGFGRKRGRFPAPTVLSASMRRQLRIK